MTGNEFHRGNPIRKLWNDSRECVKKKHSNVGGSWKTSNYTYVCWNFEICLYLFYNFDLLIKTPVLYEFRDLSCPDMVFNGEF
jgi:hypothetical protein